MKFFGWGKSKDPQPQPVLQQVNKSDSRNGSHGLDRCKSLSGMGSIMPGKGSSAGIRKQQGLFGVDDEEYLHGGASKPKASSDDADSEEKLRDKIRFVFSHEREGLLAIGTFALEQLQSIRNTIDGHQKAAPEDGFDSSTAGASALDSDMIQSSDDEDQLQRSWLAARKTCDLPVFGDVDTSGVESEAEREPQEDHQQPDGSKALTLYKSNPNRTPTAGVKPIVLTALPSEIRKALDPASALLYGKSFLPHWTDSVPPPTLAKPPAPFPDDDYYSSRLCGLFAKKKTLKSKRHSNQIVPVDGEEKKRMIPIELAHQETKKSLLKFASPGVPSLGTLARLWRATCKQSTARVAPERRPCPAKETSAKGQPCVANGVASAEVLSTPMLEVMKPPCRLPAGACSPEVEEFRMRVQMHERIANAPGELRDGVASSRDDYGHWINTDEDFVVLEM